MFLQGQNLAPVQGDVMGSAIAALGLLASSANNQYLIGYLCDIAYRLPLQWKPHGSRNYEGMAHKGSDYDLVCVLFDSFVDQVNAPDVICQMFTTLFDGKPGYECTYTRKAWCCNCVTYVVRLGGPPMKLDVLFVHMEVQRRPYVSALQTFTPLSNIWNSICNSLPENEDYLAGVACGEGVVQDYSLTVEMIVSNAYAYLTPVDKAIYLAMKKTFHSTMCPSMVLLAIYQGARFDVLKMRVKTSEYASLILRSFEKFARAIRENRLLDNCVFHKSRVNTTYKTLERTNIIHVLTAEQLNFAANTMDIRVLQGPWYALGTWDNTWLYTALVACIMKMNPDMYDAHDPQRSMQLFREKRGNSMPEVVVWDLLAIQASKKHLSFVSHEHMLVRKLVINIVQEIPALFNGRRQSPTEKAVYDLVSTHYSAARIHMPYINAIIAQDHADIILNRSINLFECAFKDNSSEALAPELDSEPFVSAVSVESEPFVPALSVESEPFVPALSVDSQPFTPATKSQTEAAVHNPPNGPAK